MQTFLPFSDFNKSFHCLDKRRAFSQTKEAKQLLNIVFDRTESKAWRNHPAALMWMDYGAALQLYYNTFYDLCKTFHGIRFVKLTSEVIVDDVILPEWLGNENFHYSHRCNLWRKALSDKDKNYMLLYNKLKDNQYFCLCDPGIDYIWPSKGMEILRI